MKMNYLGNTGLKVSELCLGTMTFGGKDYWKRVGEQSQKQANRMVDMAIDAGVNFFDTADVYSDGKSEEMLGKALKDKKRDEVIIATKVRGSMGEGPNQVGLSRHHIIEGCEASLRRLNTDYIDLYQVHSFDPGTPLEETLRALDDLVRSGKVRYIGCSNFTGWQLMKALSISERERLEKFETLQAYYSALERDLELELLPLCRDQNLGVLTWSPLSGGFLTGKYRSDKDTPGETRRSDPEEKFLRFDEQQGYKVVDKLEEIADNHDGSIPQAALNYLLAKTGVCSVIVGARTEEQLKDNLGTAEWDITREEMEEVDEINPLPRVYPYWFQKMGNSDR